MQKRIEAYIKQWKMIEKEDCVIVGVSGGADSVCLLFVLLELQKKIPFRIVAGHVNHGLRGEESDADEKYVRELCAKQGIPFESSRVNIELLAKKWKQSTEEAGRQVRRAFFENLLEQYGGTKIALAHHKNDQVETVLLNLVRGSGLKGLCGIQPVNGNVIRPLLCAKRSEIELYLKEKEIEYCTDSTNVEDVYTRNRVRNHVIPYLENDVNAQAVAHIDETATYLRQVQEYLECQMREYYQVCVKKADLGYCILKEGFEDVPEVLKTLLLRKVLAEAAGSEKDLEAAHVKSLMELFEKQVGKKVDLPYQLEGVRSYQGVEILSKSQKTPVKEEVIWEWKAEKEKTFVVQGRKVWCRVLEYTEEMAKLPKKSGAKFFDCAIMENGVSFRTRRSGDYITIHPDGKRQKLKSYFINEKIPQKERDQILLVASDSHILWAVGHRVSCACEAGEETKYVLEIQIDPV